MKISEVRQIYQKHLDIPAIQGEDIDVKIIEADTENFVGHFAFGPIVGTIHVHMASGAVFITVTEF